MSNHTYVLANTIEALNAAGPFAGTVEAEYGDNHVEGELATLAHHGPRQGQECPCLYSGPALPAGSRIGLSHVDLDTLGGCMRLAGYQPASEEEQVFWKLAAYVDLNGPHKAVVYLDKYVGEFPHVNSHEGERVLARWSLRREAADQAMAMLQAYWAWSQDHRVFAPREGSQDVTPQIEEHIAVLRAILAPRCSGGEDQHEHDAYCGCPCWGGDPRQAELLAAGKAWAEAQAELDSQSLRAEISTPMGKLLVRVANQFTNHLYGPEGAMVLALNTERGSLTLSREGDHVPVDCCAIMQSVFGPEAGGHAGIAGSPRDMVVKVSNLRRAMYKVCLELGVTLCS